jgi:hypothetical protein
MAQGTQRLAGGSGRDRLAREPEGLIRSVATAGGYRSE